MRRRISTAALLAACILFSGSFSRGEEGLLPNLVLITLDTTRRDHLGAYGYFRATSPSIDRFAGECISFDRCIVPMATTLPSHVSILTATYPSEHGVLANVGPGGKRFSWDTTRSSAVYAKEAGYRTAAFVSAVPVKKGTGSLFSLGSLFRPSFSFQASGVFPGVLRYRRRAGGVHRGARHPERGAADPRPDRG